MNATSRISSSAAAGIVLCGGQSSRMGRSKGELPFGPEMMLPRVVRILGEVASPIVVVAAQGQEVPPMPGELLLATDEREGRGPLEGLRAGLKALVHRGLAMDTAVYATSCDVPLLEPAFVRLVLEKLGPNQAAVPVDGGFFHPLAAAYRLSVLSDIEELLAANQLSAAGLVGRVPTTQIPVDDLRASDPDLHSLWNCNRPEEYEAALKIAGLVPKEEPP